MKKNICIGVLSIACLLSVGYSVFMGQKSSLKCPVINESNCVSSVLKEENNKEQQIKNDEQIDKKEDETTNTGEKVNEEIANINNDKCISTNECNCESNVNIEEKNKEEKLDTEEKKAEKVEAIKKAITTFLDFRYEACTDTFGWEAPGFRDTDAGVYYRQYEKFHTIDELYSYYKNYISPVLIEDTVKYYGLRWEIKDVYLEKEGKLYCGVKGPSGVVYLYNNSYFNIEFISSNIAYVDAVLVLDDGNQEVHETSLEHFILEKNENGQYIVIKHIKN